MPVKSSRSGDTIRVRLAGRIQTVRFTGINAMELTRYSKYPSRRRGACHGLEATALVERAIKRSGWKVRLGAQELSSHANRRLRRSVWVRKGGRWRDLSKLEMQAGLTPMQQDYVDRGRGAISMAVSLINELVELSRAEAGDLPIELDAVNLSTFVRDAAANHSTLSNAKRLLVNIDTPQRVPPVFTDPNYVREILDALLHNAVKYTPEAGCITVRLEQRDGRRLSDPLSWVCVSVQDTGPGIAEADRRKIFEEFQQADSSSTRTKGGTGLGLSISRRIVELHGGRLWVESLLGEGSTFHFSVPIKVERGAERS